jgi:hypothetical protein
MSIIHDALKKVQQGLNLKSKEEQPGPSPSPVNKNPSAYIYEEAPAAVETLSPASPKTADQKPPAKNKIKSILALACASLIIAASAFYIWQQFQSNIPQVQIFAKKSFDQLIHKKELPDFKTKPPEELKAMAQLTIDPSAAKSSGSAKLAPITLDIHGILANSTGNLVLIDDQVYQEGDVIDGAKIVKIDLDSIKIINNGVEQTIFVKN